MFSEKNWVHTLLLIFQESDWQSALLQMQICAYAQEYFAKFNLSPQI